jgi:hypothetical protein
MLKLDDLEEAQLRTIYYTVTGIPVGWQVKVSVQTNGGTVIATWVDIVVNATGNPANQFALTGSLNPMPLNATVRHNQELVVLFTILGPAPFTSPYTPLSATAAMFIEGWRSRLNDTRDGAPRPIDVGELNDVAFGAEDLLSKPVDPDLVATIEQLFTMGA